MLESLDYQALGLISGLEVHQQLLTREKLFCRCPAGLYTETHDGEMLRYGQPFYLTSADQRVRTTDCVLAELNRRHSHDPAHFGGLVLALV